LLTFAPDKAIDSIRAFLYAVTRNLATNEAKRASVRKRNWAEVAQAALRRQSSKEESELEELALLELETLPEDQRETVVLKIYSRLTFEDIAKLTDVSASTCASRYRYALEKLAQGLAARKGNP